MRSLPRPTILIAVLWLVMILVAAGHVGLSAWRGLPLQTDLMALLPAEDQSPTVHAAKARMVEELSGRVLLLVGHPDGETARQAAETLRHHLLAEGVISPRSDVPSAGAMQAIARAYAPHRAGLLSGADRTLLRNGQGQDLLTRTLSQIYGVGGLANGQLLAVDPFLLLPAFLKDLPTPASRLSLTGGWPTVTDNGQTWVLLSAELTGKAYALTTQEQMTAALRATDHDLGGITPPVQRLRLGAVFYAEAGTRQALTESSQISTLSLLMIALLLLFVFRATGPLLLSILTLCSGMLVALSVSLLAFQTLHVITLVFGASLIGVSVDYSLHVMGNVFKGVATVQDRIRHVRTGLFLGLLTTLIGYASLAFSPLPGLRQVAVFSASGLLGSFLSVLFWFPVLDRTPPRPLPSILTAIVTPLWRFWDTRSPPAARYGLILALGAIALWGSLHLATDDDVRRQQSLDPRLLQEQADILRLTGLSSTTQFFLISAPDDEEALQRSEQLADRLAPLAAAGTLAGWRSPASFVPSLARQEDNHHLISDRLITPHLLPLQQMTGLEANPPSGLVAPLTLRDLQATQALPVLDTLILAPGQHIVALEAPTDLQALRSLASGLDGVQFVDPTEDISVLFGLYRQRTLVFLGLAALLMAPLLTWRYGIRGALLTAFPPVCAVILTPLLLAAAGVPVSFFTAMALILLLSVGVDYAIFCAETDGQQDPAALATTFLAALTTFFSFGLLAISEVAALRAFGLTMSTGLLLAVLLAPIAGYARPQKTVTPHPRQQEPR